MNELIPKLLIIITVIFAAAAVARGCSAPVAEWSPEHVASANATASAVAPLLEATRTYNAVVIPEIQAAEASEAVLTVRAKEMWRRVQIVAVAAGKVIVIALAVVGLFGVAFCVCAVSVALGWRALKVAKMPPARSWKRTQIVEVGEHFHELGSGAVDAIGVPKPADIKRIAAHSEADAAKIQAIAAIIQPPGKNRVEERILELAD